MIRVYCDASFYRDNELLPNQKFTGGVGIIALLGDKIRLHSIPCNPQNNSDAELFSIFQSKYLYPTAVIYNDCSGPIGIAGKDIHYEKEDYGSMMKLAHCASRRASKYGNERCVEMEISALRHFKENKHSDPYIVALHNSIKTGAVEMKTFHNKLTFGDKVSQFLRENFFSEVEAFKTLHRNLELRDRLEEFVETEKAYRKNVVGYHKAEPQHRELARKHIWSKAQDALVAREKFAKFLAA